MNDSASIVFAAVLLSACGSGSPSGGGSQAASTGGSSTAGVVLKPNGGACDGESQSGANACAGSICLVLAPNAQAKSGICSQRCSDTQKCASSSACFTVGAPLNGEYCFRTCEGDGDCVDGFVCVEDGSAHVCLTTPAGAGGGGQGGHVDCSKCLVVETDPGMLATYCGGIAGAAQLCDCGETAPAETCQPGQGAGLWCCP
jgi:hypothetical protein